MPTYEFVCQSCLRRFDIFLPRIIRDEEKVCPNCGGKEVTQVYSNKVETRLNNLFSDSDCGSGFGGFG